MRVPGKLKVGANGKVTGPASITHNNPWPCPNGTPGVTSTMRGVIMHTMVGNLPGTIQVFNDPSYQASAHFGIAQDGSIHQFGPIGTGWEAWAQVAGNREWYSIEHADNGNPDNPLTTAQIAASAQLVEVLSRFAGFPLQVTDSVNGHGYGTHFMGGEAWGGHTCPDLPPEHVRSLQRAPVIDLAQQIRDGGPFPSGAHRMDGVMSMSVLAERQGLDVADLWWATAAAKSLGALERAHLDSGGVTAEGAWTASAPAGLIVILP